MNTPVDPIERKLEKAVVDAVESYFDLYDGGPKAGVSPLLAGEWARVRGARSALAAHRTAHTPKVVPQLFPPNCADLETHHVLYSSVSGGRTIAQLKPRGWLIASHDGFLTFRDYAEAWKLGWRLDPDHGQMHDIASEISAVYDAEELSPRPNATAAFSRKAAPEELTPDRVCRPPAEHEGLILPPEWIFDERVSVKLDDGLWYQANITEKCGRFYRVRTLAGVSKIVARDNITKPCVARPSPEIEFDRDAALELWHAVQRKNTNYETLIPEFTTAVIATFKSPPVEPTDEAIEAFARSYDVQTWSRQTLLTGFYKAARANFK